MKFETTERGFGVAEFKDRNGVECSIQESSIMDTEGCIWLGANDIGLKHFKAYQGWKDVVLTQTMEEHYVANNRMHLTQSNVKELLPTLAYFAETGYLPSPGEEIPKTKEEKLLDLLMQWIPLRRQIIAGETPEMGALYRQMCEVLNESPKPE